MTTNPDDGATERSAATRRPEPIGDRVGASKRISVGDPMRRPMPSIRSIACVGSTLAVLVLSGVAAAQGASPNPGSDLPLGTQIAIRVGVSLVVYLLLAGGLVTLGPRYATETVADLHEDPIGPFGWGLLVGIAVPIALVLIALTVVGLLVTIPGLIFVFLLGVVGNAVSIVWVGDTLTGADGDASGTAAVAGALSLAIAGAIPILGDFVVGLVMFFGLGAVSRRLYASRRGSRRGGRGGRPTGSTQF